MTRIHEADAPLEKSALDLLLEMGKKRGLERGMQQGMQQGIEQGVVAGLRTLLGEQLRERFGELPGDIVARLAGADAPTLQTWGRRVLTARTLAEVLAPR